MPFFALTIFITTPTYIPALLENRNCSDNRLSNEVDEHFVDVGLGVETKLKKIKGASEPTFSLQAGPFKHQKEADYIADIMQSALHYYGLLSRQGLWAGYSSHILHRTVTAGKLVASSYGLAMMHSSGGMADDVILINAIVGAYVVEIPIGGRIAFCVSSDVHPCVRYPVAQLELGLKDAAVIGTEPNSDLVIAIELYNSSKFENSPRARLLTLIASLETISPKTEAPTEIKELVQRVKGEIREMSLSTEEQQSCLSSLDYLLLKSITRRLKVLLCDHGGFGDQEEVGEFVRRVYTLRSSLLHSGGTRKRVDLGDPQALIEELDSVVHRTLLSLHSASSRATR